MRQHAPRRGVLPLAPPRRLPALLAALVLAAGALLLHPSGARANGVGDSLYTRASTSEVIAYSRVIRLAHSGSADGTLIGTFEHAARDGGPTSLVIRTSTDDGATWRTLTTLQDPLTGTDHPSDQIWQPFLFELPRQMGSYPAGTLLLTANIAPSTNTRTDFVLWRSTDHGATWSYQSVLQTGGGSRGAPNGGSGIWEPFLTVDGAGRLALYFADERGEPAYAQTVSHMVSGDGGVTWSARPDGTVNVAPGLVDDVRSTSATDRPGMPTTATLPDGRMVLAYEICGTGRNCEAYTKTSTDGGTTWGGGPADLGTMAVTTDGRYLGSSPYLVWSPAGGTAGRLLLSGMRTRFTGSNAFTPEDRQAIFTRDADSSGAWSWTPAPFQPLAGGTYCSTSYSPHLLPDATGTSVRYTTATATGPTGCMAATAAANSGVLPYTADFTRDTSGWIEYGGCWAASNGVVSESCGGTDGNKSVAGSTSWTDYQMEGEVRRDSGTQAGFVVRATDPRTGADALDGYYVGVSSATLFLGRQRDSWTPLAQVAIPGGLATGVWYRVTVRATGCTLTVTGVPAGSSASPVGFTHTDSGCSLTSGAVGLRDQAGTASWRNITVR
ncbi:family 16 glycoside hydrolase [Streptomyces sp. NPDC093085]|uniref:family 16 glycoside hydrolase n=1 Tax=Streptomyces sp. NPDC093085 TaxID=3155068 RepID=UPI00343DF6FB